MEKVGEGGLKNEMTNKASPWAGLGGTAAGTPMHEFKFVAKLDRSHVLATLLSCIHSRREGTQLCVVSVDEGGVQFTVDEGRGYQASVYLRRDVFVDYVVAAVGDVVGRGAVKFEFRVALGTLLDCLNVYGPNKYYSTLQLVYNGLGTPLFLVLEDSGVVTDCGLKTVESDGILDIGFHQIPVINRVVIRSVYLKDAVEELDWSSDLLTLELSPEFPFFRMQTSGAGGSCQVEYAKESEVFETFHCTTPMRACFRVRACLSMIAALKSSYKTTLRLNQRMFLQVQHSNLLDDGSLVNVDYIFAPVEEDMEDIGFQ